MRGQGGRRLLRDARASGVRIPERPLAEFTRPNELNEALRCGIGSSDVNKESDQGAVQILSVKGGCFLLGEHATPE